MSVTEEDEKKPQWNGLELRGPIKNISSTLWTFTFLKSLFLNDNNLQRLPPDIAELKHLIHLDLSGNKLRSLPVELGDMISLRELLLNNNVLRILPCELGRLFLLQSLGVSGNPLSHDILAMASEVNGTAKLLTFLIDNLTGTTVVCRHTHSTPFDFLYHIFFLSVCSRPPDREWISFGHQRKQGTCIYKTTC